MPKHSLISKRLSRREQRDLDIEIEFIEGIVKRDPRYVEALRVLGDDYTRRGRVTDGLQVDTQLVQLRPNDPMVHYNLACSFSLTGQWQAAVRELDLAINLGYRDFRWLARDPDLRPLRQHPLYSGLRARIQALKQKGEKADPD
jgi:tetratricopeptide (TPR) repeat protein